MRQKRGKKVEKSGAEKRMERFEEGAFGNYGMLIPTSINPLSYEIFTLDKDNNIVSTTHSLNHSIDEHWGKE